MDEVGEAVDFEDEDEGEGDDEMVPTIVEGGVAEAEELVVVLDWLLILEEVEDDECWLWLELELLEVADLEAAEPEEVEGEGGEAVVELA